MLFFCLEKKKKNGQAFINYATLKYFFFINTHYVNIAEGNEQRKRVDRVARSCDPKEFFFVSKNKCYSCG